MPSRERVRWAKFRVVSVCIASLAILLVLFYLLTGGTLLEQKATLYLYVNDATGIGTDSPVRVNGITVGKVTAVELTQSNDRNRIIRITMRVERDRLSSIPVDSQAQLSADTVIGDQFVDISSGRSAQRVAPGGEIQFQPPSEMFKSLDIPQLEAQVRTIDALLASIARGEGPLGKFVASDEIYVTLRDRIGALHNAMHEATATTGAVGQLLYTDQMYQRIRAPILKVDQALAAIQSGQGTAGQLLRDNAQYDRARDAIQGVRKSIEGLHASAFIQSDKLYNDWTRSIAGLARQVDAINTNPLLLTSEMYDNLNGAAREVRDTVKEFREDPRKFLRLKLF